MRGRASEGHPLTIMFTDLEGSTSLRTRLGDVASEELMRLHDRLVRERVGSHSGRVVDATGDGFMVTFGSVRNAIACAVDIQRTLETHSPPEQEEDRLRVRIGINTGEVIYENNRVRGEAVHAAARVMSKANGGEILVSEVVKQLAGTIPEVAFRDRGRVVLKGFPDRWRLLEVVWRSLLRVRLLGGMDVRYATERLLALDSPRLQSLLAYLLLHRDAPQQRQHLAFVLWPDSTEAQARTNLRQLLHHLRRAIPQSESFLEVGPARIQWRSDGPFSLDVAQFELAADRADKADDDEAREILEEAVALYGGELLPGCYDEWILAEREGLRDRNVELLEQLITILEQERDYQAGARYAELLLRSDPLHESTYRRLMRLYSLCGDRARALRVYHRCATVLERELGVEPSPATRDAYAALLSLESAVDVPETRPPTLATEWPLLGRHAEWERAVAAWHAAVAGGSRFLVVNGEPGIGKSRLVQELEIWCARQGIATARTRSYVAEGTLAYAPVVEWLRSETLRPGLAKLSDVWLTEVARLLPELLTDNPELPPPDRLTESEQRQRLFEALARAIFVGEKPLLLVLDDIQWCDQETLEFLHYLVRLDPGMPLLIAATARVEEVGTDHPATTLFAAIRSRDELVEISLGPLDEAGSFALAKELSDREIEPEVAQRLYREAEGNPLFLVESVRAGLATGEMPPKVQSVIEARLAQLSPVARDMVGLAATVGREFTFEVLRGASTHDEDTLVRGLDELWRRRIIREQGANAYDFSHDKLREVAYALLGPIRRTRLHLSIARALETHYASDLDPVSGQIATHYERAGSPAKAIPHYARAAAVAQARFANEEAIAFLKRALRLLSELPLDRARDEQELELLMAIGPPTVALRGYGSPDAREIYSSARELCERLGTVSTAPILRGLAMASIGRSEIDKAFELGEELLTMAETERNAFLIVEAHYVLGVTTFWRGEFEASRRHLQESIALYSPDNHREHVNLFAQDPKVICLTRLGYTLWHLGYPDQAIATGEEGLALAEDLAHPLSLSYAINFMMMLTNDCREVHRIEELTTAQAAFSRDMYLFYNEALRVVFSGWMQVQREGSTSGISMIHEGLARYEATGQDLHLPYALMLLARAHLLTADPSAALDVISDCFEFADRTNNHHLDAELHRLRAEALIALDPTDEPDIEVAFGRALEVARRQSAKSFELRSALGLARWRESSGSEDQKQDARRLLQEVYSWFTEGHNTADLVEAREFLAGA
ncbi:MAG TPA: BTAD domain-containing putative transcriptional regulator [Actinomycetota bacterium]|nr:BTAD domain-containing putative transcriptional regulator [Actinomycetota bacterium]